MELYQRSIDSVNSHADTDGSVSKAYGSWIGYLSLFVSLVLELSLSPTLLHATIPVVKIVRKTWLVFFLSLLVK